MWNFVVALLKHLIITAASEIITILMYESIYLRERHVNEQQHLSRCIISVSVAVTGGYLLRKKREGEGEGGALQSNSCVATMYFAHCECF